ncbi:MAG: gliding motility-associated C-terminal domain-containing protein [Bacteroidota bacterium]
MRLYAITLRKLLGVFFLFLLCAPSFGRHLVGGDFTYVCLGQSNGQNEYRISLNVYRDCVPVQGAPSNTPFDDSVKIGLFDGGDKRFLREIVIQLVDSVILDLSSNDPCIPAPTNLCYTRTSYTQIVRLPDNPNGYYLEWGRCCRNENIVNIINPGQQGMVLSAYIPDTKLCNSSASFANNFPTYICSNDQFNYDHHAFDKDGDSLVYRLVTPYTAGSPETPFPDPAAPPYEPITWAPGYGGSNILDGSPALTIGRETGELSVRPRQIGQYVFGISVTEYRDGVRITEVRRDIQINIIPCPINFPPSIIRPVAGEISEDTLTFVKSRGSCFDFIIEDINGQGIDPDNLSISVSGALFDGNHGAEYFAGSGISPQDLSICWAPSCELGGLADNRIIVRVEDENNCPSPNIVYDTLYVRVLDGPLLTPNLKCFSFTPDGHGLISWDTLGFGEDRDFHSFILFRNDGSGWEDITTISDPNITSYIDTDVNKNSGNTYCYQLQIQKNCFGPTLGEPSNIECSEKENLSKFCRISADPGTQGITLEWSPNLNVGFASYKLYRRGANDSEFQLLVEIQDQAILQYQDGSAPIEDGPVCYQLGVIDECGTEVISSEGCSIYGQISSEDFSVSLDWTPYTGWSSQVGAYEIWSYLPDSSTIVLSSLPEDRTSYRDNEVRNSQAVYCYRIRAIPPEGECGEDAWSPEICIDFDPLVYVPTAFSPNGDGRNDRFTIKGAFLPQISLQIYSRWGRKVYETNSLEQAWDGSISGGTAPEGVYVYHLRFESPDGKMLTRTGSIVLIR